ncbi:MAG: ATP-binding protein [Acholeplasmataceae bacterium]|jgi:two-component system phosphate regulon sensor histidine kinase PhoR|nr:ATP-binding protein [Acholeplasmataceae bacterium]
MKKTIIRNNILLLLAVFLLFFVLFFYTLYYFNTNQQKEYMDYIVTDIKQAYENYEDGIENFIIDYDNDDRRITILDEFGFVLADTHDEVIGTDKSGRPEIKDIGTVYTRRSNTIDKDLIYIAKLLDDGNILRVSVKLAPILAVYETVIWIFLIGGLVLMTIYYFGLMKINKNLLNPWMQVKKGIIALNRGQYQMMSLTSNYPEINEILHEMNQINLETQNQLYQITNYQLQLDKILNEMKQAVVLLNDESEIIYYNTDAQKLFDLTEQSLFKPSYQFIRDHQIHENIDKVLSHKESTHFDINFKNRTLECRLFTLKNQFKIRTNATVLLLVRDVSQERLIDQMKKDFFSHASHELKSPLTAIKGNAELIKHHMVKGDDLKKSTDQIITQTEMMALLVEDMLMLSRLENIKEEPEEVHALDHILDEVLNQMEPLAKSKQVELHVTKQKIEMICDSLDMQKLFKNLIENAIKYSDVDKDVWIDLKMENDGIIFLVKDEGIGISSEHQQRVFERFYRVDKGRLDNGTGLGLAIVKHIVLKYHGHMDLTSSLGKGTTIVITLNKIIHK